ncbi:hypothetical protein AB5I41_31390 [Sphingomonas sp. MMS24-JH45]
MNLGKLLGSIVKKAKENPELALVVVSIAAPGLARKVAPIVIAATRKPTEIR